MDDPSSFRNHLGELRSGLIKSFLFISLGFLISWFFCENILDFIRQPIVPFLNSTNGKLIFTNPVEKFLSYLKLSVFSGIVISCPFWLFQIWKFISPGLYSKERKGTFLFVFIGSVLFLLGGIFVYFIVYPSAFHFLLYFGGENELPFISLKEYLSFFIRTSFMFALVFETPLLIFSLLKLNILSLEKLKSSRKGVFVLIAILSALLTPPDVMSMVFMMIPIYLLFEFSIFTGRWIA